jgi:hypothetical protein
MSNNIYLPPSPVTPMSLLIASISNSFPAIVTVSMPNNYVAQQLIYFSVPSDYGMEQINAKTAEIISVDPTNLIFTVAIDTTVFDPFVIPTTSKQVPASLAPAGSRNLYNTQQVPFRSVNGQIGN